MAPGAEVAVPPRLLQQLDHVYYGKVLRDGSSELLPELSVRSLGTSLGVQVGEPPVQALVLVIGDTGSGKTAFVNALAQELSLPALPSLGAVPSARRRLPVEWVRSASSPSGAVPRLLAEVAARFPGFLPAETTSGPSLLAACCAGRSASERLDGVELAEVRPPADDAEREALSWLASRAAVVVCLLNSQKQPPISDALLAWLAGLPSQGNTGASGDSDDQVSSIQLQFVFSKADLIARESERIRLVAKASRLLTDRFGRSFEILPAASGDLRNLLDTDIAESIFTVDGQEFSLPARSKTEAARGHTTLHDGAQLRALEAAKEVALRKSHEGLDLLRADCEALTRASDSQLAEARKRGRAASNGLQRDKLLQCAAALAIVGVIIPFVLEEDVEQWLVYLCVASAFGLAALLLIGAWLVPAPAISPPMSSPTGNMLEHIAAMEEQDRFLRLLARQRALWCGESLEAPMPTPMGQEERNQQETDVARRHAGGQPGQAPSKMKDERFTI